jgi:glucose-6-phosphate isomerase
MQDLDLYRDLSFHDHDSGFSIDLSTLGVRRPWLLEQTKMCARALRAMTELEAGDIANPDEGRQVGHYWLRAPELAPDPAVSGIITATRKAIELFAARVLSGDIHPPGRVRFTHVLLVGIGGSALGPQFVSRCLASPTPPLQLLFLDNTDPDGVDRTLKGLGAHLESTLVLVISKSGGTAETRNGAVLVRHALESMGRRFPPQAVAVTAEGSALCGQATAEGWLAKFPMWDWVGGRTSVTSAVGLLPAALQGIDIGEFLLGAATMDRQTRNPDLFQNPALLLALGLWFGSEGRGAKDLVVLPYRDRLELFSRYLQQLVMESIGKERSLAGDVVEQGLTVYGNKGSTDQHAFVQQLRDGVPNAFTAFIEVLSDGDSNPIAVDATGATAGDYLIGFLLGTRRALAEKGRGSLMITLPDLSPSSVGGLIALFERAVGFYGSFAAINPYHQPGVEAGKKAAGGLLDLQARALRELRDLGRSVSAEELAAHLGAASGSDLFILLRHLHANGRVQATGVGPSEMRFGAP